MDELISIIIPVYNSEKYITRCLNSASRQTYKNIEIICVNDGSVDNSKNIIEKHMKNDIRIMLINQKNSGVQFARKKGFNISNGKYIFFLDSDDYIEKNAIEILYNYMEKYNADVVKAQYYRKIGLLKKKTQFIKDVQIFEKKDLNKKVYPMFIDSYRLSNIWGELIKKDCINESFFNMKLKYAEDLYFNIKLYQNINSLVILNVWIYNYCYNKSSSINSIIDKNKFLKKISDIVYVNDVIINNFSDSIDIKLLFNYFFQELYKNFLFINYIKTSERDETFNEVIHNKIILKNIEYIKNNNISLSCDEFINIIYSKDLNKYIIYTKKDIFKNNLKSIIKKIF